MTMRSPRAARRTSCGARFFKSRIPTWMTAMIVATTATAMPAGPPVGGGVAACVSVAASPRPPTPAARRSRPYSSRPPRARVRGGPARRPFRGAPAPGAHGGREIVERGARQTRVELTHEAGRERHPVLLQHESERVGAPGILEAAIDGGERELAGRVGHRWRVLDATAQQIRSRRGMPAPALDLR